MLGAGVTIFVNEGVLAGDAALLPRKHSGGETAAGILIRMRRRLSDARPFRSRPS